MDWIWIIDILVTFVVIAIVFTICYIALDKIGEYVYANNLSNVTNEERLK